MTRHCRQEALTVTVLQECPLCYNSLYTYTPLHGSISYKRAIKLSFCWSCFMCLRVLSCLLHKKVRRDVTQPWLIKHGTVLFCLPCCWNNVLGLSRAPVSYEPRTERSLQMLVKHWNRRLNKRLSYIIVMARWTKVPVGVVGSAHSLSYTWDNRL